MPEKIKSHYRNGVQYYWESPSKEDYMYGVNKDVFNQTGYNKHKKAFEFVKTLVKMGVPHKAIETNDWKNNLAPAVYVLGKHYAKFGPKTLAKIEHKKVSV